jgi:hypothetical protein
VNYGDADWAEKLLNGIFEVEVSGTRFAATISCKPSL